MQWAQSTEGSRSSGADTNNSTGLDCAEMVSFFQNFISDGSFDDATCLLALKRFDFHTAMTPDYSEGDASGGPPDCPTGPPALRELCIRRSGPVRLANGELDDVEFAALIDFLLVVQGNTARVDGKDELRRRLKHDDATAMAAGGVLPETDWFSAAGHGVFTHLLSNLQNEFGRNSQGKNSSWDDCVNGFDAEAYADSAAATGARYAVLTLTQQERFIVGPNAAFDRYTGYGPGSNR